MELVVFHYHLRPGGVTVVITDALQALCGHRFPELTRILLVTGSEENVAEITKRILSGCENRERTISVDVCVIPEMRYAAEMPGSSISGIAFEISKRLQNLISTDSLWWVHNHHIGKNPGFTSALLDTAAAYPQQRILLQIHDFPECARYENLQFLRSHVSRPVYPEAGNVRFAVINDRDAELLTEAGVNASRISVIPNPVRSGMAPSGGESRSERQRAARRAFSRAFPASVSQRFPGYRPDGLLFLYPVRAIRRKNVLEAGLLARLFSHRSGSAANLVVTLPGTSDQERAYSDLVAHAFESGVIPGLWAAGTELDDHELSFADVTDAADLIVSSSVQEGFGYAFVQALVWQHPLVARYLDVTDGLRPMFSRYPALFYRELLVPFNVPGVSALKTLLRFRYKEQIERVRPYVPAGAIAALNEELEVLLSREDVEFSFLPAEAQFAVLSALRDRRFASDVCARNADLLEGVEDVIGADCSAGPQLVEDHLAFAAFAANFRAAVDAFGPGLGMRENESRTNAGNAPPAGKPARHTSARASTSSARMQKNSPDATEDFVQNALIRHFARLDYLRLVYTTGANG